MIYFPILIYGTDIKKFGSRITAAVMKLLRRVINKTRTYREKIKKKRKLQLQSLPVGTEDCS